MTEVIERQCADCGRDFMITLDEDQTILDEDVRYYGTVKLPVEGTGEWVDDGTTEVAGHEFGVTDWTGEYDECEWWECGCEDHE